MPQAFDLSLLTPDFLSFFEGTLSATEMFSTGIVLFLLFCTLGLILFVLGKYIYGRQAVNFYLDLVNGLNDQSFVLKQRDLKTIATENKKFGPLWISFDRSLYSVEGEQFLRRTYDADYWFNARSLGAGLVDNRLLAAAPGWLTALGVIGTFSGLMLGLSGLSLNPDETEQLTSGVFSMINGAAVAFMTSLWGILASLAFNVIEKILERGIRKRTTGLAYTLDSLTIPTIAEQTLVSAEQQIRETNKALMGLGEQLGDRLQETFQEANQDFLKTVASSLDRMTSSMQAAPKENLKVLVEGFVEKVSAAGETQAKEMQKISAEFQKSTSLLGDKVLEMSEKVQEIHAQAEQRDIARSESLEIQARGVSQHFESIVSMQKEHSNSTSENISSLCLTLTSLLESVQNLSGEMASAASKMSESTNGSVKLSADITKNMSEILSTSKTLGETLKGMNTALLEGLSSQTSINDKIGSAAESIESASRNLAENIATNQQTQTKIIKNLDKQISNLEERQRAVLESYASQVDTQVKDRMSVWNQQTTQVLNSMTDTIKVLSDLIDEIESKANHVPAA